MLKCTVCQKEITQGPWTEFFGKPMHDHCVPDIPF